MVSHEGKDAGNRKGSRTQASLKLPLTHRTLENTIDRHAYDDNTDRIVAAQEEELAILEGQSATDHCCAALAKYQVIPVKAQQRDLLPA
jgi:hypothetical protein